MIILIQFLWHSDLHNSPNNNIKFISVALKLTAGIQFNQSIDFNGIQQNLQKTSTCDRIPHMIAIPESG